VDDGVSWIQHSAPISPGSSGGALISSRGELLGINSHGLQNSQNLNFAVPARTLAEALSGARALTGSLDFPSELTGTYSGSVLNRTTEQSSDFTIVVTESGEGFQGCLAVKPPLVGSGYLRGTVHGSQFSFLLVSDSARGSFEGQRDTNKLSGTYSFSPDGGSEQHGTFVLHKTSAEGPSIGIDIQNCPNDAAVAREAAERGDATAQLYLGFRYGAGRGVPQDYSMAAYWIRKSAEQGNTEAETTFGAIYELGKGVPQDYVQAAQWYRRAAEQGYAEAQSQLGVLYSSAGKGVPQDEVQAAMWFRKAAQQGDAAAQLNLGAAYLLGLGLPKDYSEAYFWTKLGAAGEVKGATQEDVMALLDEIAAHLTASALADVQQRAGAWLVTHHRPTVK
jgi:hypothetical protein